VFIKLLKKLISLSQRGMGLEGHGAWGAAALFVHHEVLGCLSGVLCWRSTGSGMGEGSSRGCGVWAAALVVLFMVLMLLVG
jgi:hypothetical protein